MSQRINQKRNKKYLETNRSREKVIFQIYKMQQGSSKGRFIVINAYLKKEKSLKQSSFEP